MRFFIPFTLFMLMLTGCNSIAVEDIQEGDVVFIESQSAQSPYIKVGTMSKWTHCGVIVSTADGLQVLEASKTVRLTPVKTFIGRGKNDNWRIKRPDQQLPKRISYSKYLDMPYDLQFKFDNGKMYCSELVWQIYKDQGIELCEPVKIKEHFMVRLPAMQRALEERGISPEQAAVAPCDLLRAL